jgi:DNA-binding Lrp family transcriptional regulator
MIFKPNTFKVAQLFLDYPTREFYLREVARVTQISAATVFHIMKELEKAKIVTREKTPAIDKFKAATETRQYISVKKAYNLYRVFASEGLSQFIHYAESKAIYATGPYTQGRNEADDALVIYCVDARFTNFQKETWEKEIGRKIAINFISARKLSSYYGILLDGILLHGHLEVP